MAPPIKNRNNFLRASIRVLLILTALKLTCCSAGTATVRKFLHSLDGIKSELDAIMMVRSDVCHGQFSMEKKNEDCNAACPFFGYCVPNKVLKVFPSHFCMCSETESRDEPSDLSLKAAWQEWLNGQRFEGLAANENRCANKYDMGPCTRSCFKTNEWIGKCLFSGLGFPKKYQCYCYLLGSDDGGERTSMYLPPASTLLMADTILCKVRGGSLSTATQQCDKACPDGMQGICMKAKADAHLISCYCTKPATETERADHILFTKARLDFPNGIRHGDAIRLGTAKHAVNVHTPARKDQHPEYAGLIINE